MGISDIMKNDYGTLTEAESSLLERFKKFDEAKLSIAVRECLDDYIDGIFIPDVFAIMVEDVFEVLSISAWDRPSYKKVIAYADYICQKTGCFFPCSDYFCHALPIVWVSYCCHYKKYGYAQMLSSDTWGLYNNSADLEQSISAYFFNHHSGYPKGKVKKFQEYMFRVHGERYVSGKNDNHILNFESLMYILSLTGFYYQMPLKSINEPYV